VNPICPLLLVLVILKDTQSRSYIGTKGAMPPINALAPKHTLLVNFSSGFMSLSLLNGLYSLLSLVLISASSLLEFVKPCQIVAFS